jgi:nitroreductase
MTAATLAPSCANKQPWRFVVVDQAESLALVRPALSSGNYWALKAPVLVAVFSRLDLDARLDDQRDYALFDTGLATANLLAQANAEGLIAHPIAGFDPLKLKAALGVPVDYVAITVVVIAWPGSSEGLNPKHLEAETAPRNRKPMAEVVAHNGWHL